MLIRTLVVVGLVGIMNFAAQTATAQEAAAPSASIVALDGIRFSDPSRDMLDGTISLQIGQTGQDRLANLNPSTWRDVRQPNADTSYEVALVARGAAGFDLSVARRGAVGFNAMGDISRRSSSNELRLGRALRREDDQPLGGSWYVFAASEDEALIWRPGQRNAFGSVSSGFALQEDRVEIGDIQAGLTYEANGMQASLAYVEREISVTMGQHSWSQDERFVGFTLTLQR